MGFLCQFQVRLPNSIHNLRIFLIQGMLSQKFFPGNSGGFVLFLLKQVVRNQILRFENLSLHLAPLVVRRILSKIVLPYGDGVLKFPLLLVYQP